MMKSYLRACVILGAFASPALGETASDSITIDIKGDSLSGTYTSDTINQKVAIQILTVETFCPSKELTSYTETKQSDKLTAFQATCRN